MKILVESNIILDVLLRREEHFDALKSILDLSASAITAFLTVYQTRDIFYILRRSGLATVDAKESIKLLTTGIHVLNAEVSDVVNALNSRMIDYEDALLAYCANRHGMDFIVTRNVKDFINSPVAVLTPVDFLNRLTPKSTTNALNNDN